MLSGEVVAAGDDADFNQDSNVDGSDFLTWQTNAGSAGTLAYVAGDANNDGQVGGADLAIWETPTIMYGTT